MKKIIQATAGFLLLLLANTLYATPLITNSVSGTLYSIDIDSDGDSDYTVVNRKQATDIWSATYGGYYKDDTINDTDFTGYYLGTVQDANDNGDLQLLLAYYLDESNITYDFSKVDEPAITNGTLNVTYDSDNKTGSWAVLGNLVVYFYSVKSANEYALYYIDPASSSGEWTTAHLRTPNEKNIPEISHLTVATDPGNPVPEPTTMLLFGTGIAGLAGIARRKWN